jgi:hypothetical protein
MARNQDGMLERGRKLTRKRETIRDLTPKKDKGASGC